MYNIYNIEDKVVEKIAKFLEITRIELDFNKSARIVLDLLDDDRITIQKEEVILTPEEYNLWGNDDNYILQLIETKLNIKIK